MDIAVVTGFLAGLGGKVVERWLSLLTLPGCLFVGAAWVASALGQSRATDRKLLADTVAGWYEGAQEARPGTLAAVAAGLLLLAALAALTARMTGQVVLLLWFARRPGLLGRHMRAVEQRVSDYYQIDLEMLWPRLWLVLAPPARKELRTVITAVESATVVGAWGLCYLVLGSWWWPAAVIGAVVLAAGWVLARQHTVELAALVEGAVDVGLRPVARSLGITPPPAASPAEVGLRLAPVLHKRLADDSPPSAPGPERWQAPSGPPVRRRGPAAGGP
ncbi:hypothetical protein AB0E00_07945 [Streptomyces sp. NPDC048110]|uniref:hypothetical protein n=1 Tax=Streptomyces sp. NPDC048110 TaxID=3155483 RepID=UPI0033FFBFCB